MMVQSYVTGTAGGLAAQFFTHIASENANNFTGSVTALNAYAEHRGTGNITGELIGMSGGAIDDNPNGRGTVYEAIGVRGTTWMQGALTSAVTYAMGVVGENFLTAGHASASIGVYAKQPSVGASALLDTNIGLLVDNVFDGTNGNINILIASSANELGGPSISPPGGAWAIYNDSTRANYFNGNFGIGTTSIGSTLEVAGTASISGHSYFGSHVSVSGNFELSGFVSSNLTPTVTDTYDLGTSALRWRDLYLASGSLHIGTAGDEAVIDYNVNDDYLALKPNGSTNRLQLFDTGAASISNTLYVTSGGNVGVGTNSPTLARFQVTSPTAGDFALMNVASATGETAFHITKGGNVGIGNAVAPSAQLHVYGDSGDTARFEQGGVLPSVVSLYSGLGTGTVGRLSFYGVNDLAQATIYSAIASNVVSNANTAEQGALIFNTTNSGASGERMRLNNTGNLGIGTTDPTTKLHVSIGSGVTDAIKLSPTFGAATGTAVVFQADDPSLGGVFNAGRIYSAWTFSTGTASAAYMSFQLPANTGGNWTTIMTLASSSRVGIGNTTPDALLHVGSTSVTDGATLIRTQDSNSICNFTANAGSPTCGSDYRLKKDIEELESGALEKLTALNVVTYRWKTDSPYAPVQTGFIAQNVQSQFPDLVTTSTWVDDEPALFLSQNGLIPYLVKAVQEQQVLIEALQAGINAPTIPLLAEDDTTFLDRIVALFSSILGIEFGQGSIAVDELCVGSVCVTEEQFIDVFGNGSGSPETPTPSPTSTEEPTPTPDATPEPTPENSPSDEPFEEPTPEPAPEESPAEEPSLEPEPQL